MDVLQEQEVVARELLLNMKKHILHIFLVFSCICSAQQTLDQLLDQYTTGSIPYISSEGLHSILDTVTILDTREKGEYEVSHLQKAIHVGYDHFKIKSVRTQNIQKNDHIIVYCSLGIRSEHIGKRLKTAGYQHVYNLYGGIFEWKNKGYEVVDANSNTTDTIHAYSEEWSKWLLKGKKVYTH